MLTSLIPAAAVKRSPNCIVYTSKVAAAFDSVCPVCMPDRWCGVVFVAIFRGEKRGGGLDRSYILMKCLFEYTRSRRS